MWINRAFCSSIFRTFSEFPNQFHYLCLGHSAWLQIPDHFLKLPIRVNGRVGCNGKILTSTFGGAIQEKDLHFWASVNKSIWYWLRWISFCFLHWSISALHMGSHPDIALEFWNWIAIQPKLISMDVVGIDPFFRIRIMPPQRLAASVQRYLLEGYLGK